MNISVDLSALSQLDRFAADFDNAVEGALDAVAEDGLRHKEGELQRGTYDRPERRLKSGRRAWVRTQQLLRSQRIRRGPGVRFIEAIGAAARYEGRVADLPTGPDGINRSNAAAAKTAAWLEDGNAQRIAEDEIKRRLGL